VAPEGTAIATVLLLKLVYGLCLIVLVLLLILLLIPNTS
jgi:hypothetical protein